MKQWQALTWNKVCSSGPNISKRWKRYVVWEAFQHKERVEGTLEFMRWAHGEKAYEVTKSMDKGEQAPLFNHFSKAGTKD